MAKLKKDVLRKVRVVPCFRCNEPIEIEPYYGRGDMIYCDECGGEYVIRSLRPLKIVRMEDDEGDDWDVYC